MRCGAGGGDKQMERVTLGDCGGLASGTCCDLRGVAEGESSVSDVADDGSGLYSMWNELSRDDIVVEV